MNNSLISLGSTFLVSKGRLSLKVAVKFVHPDWWVVVVGFSSPTLFNLQILKYLWKRYRRCYSDLMPRYNKKSL